jgi:apolipoprotein N-acyltransferase
MTARHETAEGFMTMRTRSGVSLCAGMLLPLAFAPLQLAPLAVLAPALLFLCWRGARPADAFRYGWLFGFGMFGVGVNWLHISINLFGGVNLAGAIAATLLLVAFLALVPAAAGYAARRLAPASTVVFLMGTAPAAWVLGEWTRTWLLTGFPWLFLGYSQTDTPLGALAAPAGVLGVSWATAVIAGVLAAFGGLSRMQRALGVAAILIPLGAGWLSARHDWTLAETQRLSAAVIQGSIRQELKWRPESRDLSIARYLALTEDHWDADIIVWPETAIPAFHTELADFLRILGDQARAEDADLYIGLPIADRASGRYFNGVLLVNRPGSEYHKRHLVPFGEYLPLRPWIGGLFRFLAIPMSDFSPGSANRPLLEGNHGAAGISICYEDAFGAEVIEALPQARLLINVSNDAWFGDSWAPHQHLQIARMRAVETGRFLLRATNTGVSAIIDEKGGIVAASTQSGPAAIRADIKLFGGQTPYARTGNAPVIGATLFVLLALYVRDRRRQPDRTAAAE